ncbi:MAG: ATP-dependent Clp protease ATP-binding subunit ClpC, partial [Candidatus Berkelbacteria bacterium Athens1014_28]
MAKLNYNSAGTRIKKLVKINQLFSSFPGKILSMIFWLVGFFSVASLSLTLISTSFDFPLGWSLILLVIFLIFLALRAFFRFFVQNPEILSPMEIKEKAKKKEDIKYFDCLSVAAASALMSVSSDIEEVDICSVFISLVKSPASNFIFNRIGVAKEDVLEKIATVTGAGAVRFSQVAERSIEIAILENHNKVEVGDILVAISELDPDLTSFISEKNLDSNDLANIVYWQTSLEKKIEKGKKILDPSDLHLSGGIGRDWAFGYTLDLNQFSTDLTEEVNRFGLGLEIIGHERETTLLEQALNRVEGANAILVGEPGIGKKTIVLGLAKKLNDGKASGSIYHKHIRELNVDLLISGLSGPGEFTERLTRVFSQAANAGNIIIFIDGLEKLLSSGEAGQIDASAVLSPYLAYPEINFICTMNAADYNSLIPNSPIISQKMERIEVSEPNGSEMIRILEDMVLKVENHFKILVTYSAIKEVAKLANKYLLDQPNPEKSISL